MDAHRVSRDVPDPCEIQKGAEEKERPLVPLTAQAEVKVD
jgi:hypothetical protein